MHRNDPRTALLLLVVFLTGGVMAPVLHQPRHARSLEHRHGASEAPHHRAEAAPGAENSFLVEEQTPYEDGRCEICARLSLGFSLAEAVPAPYLYLSSWVVSAAHSFTSDSRRYFSIRAPPSA